MKIELSPEILEQLKQQISKCIIDTLRVMFGIEVCLTTSPVAIKGEKFVKSHVELSNSSTKAILVIAVPLTIASMIADNFKPSDDTARKEIIQGVSNEIANIVVHVIRTHLIFTHGLFLDVTLPHACDMVDLDSLDVVSLYFLIKPEETMGVNFHY
jgi:hypothetical protein